MFERRPLLTAILILTLVFLAANQLLVRGEAAGIWDANGQFFPYFVLVADHIRALRLVLWDPWTHGGIPLLGDPQVGAFSPITTSLGLVFGGSAFGFRAYWLLSWWLGGLGMLLLAHHLRAPLWGAVAVGLGFAFCGVYLSNAQHTPWLVAYSFLPLVVWRLDVALLSRSIRPAVEAGALWGLSALSGYPGIVLITGCFCALWAVGRVLFPPDSGPAHHGGQAISRIPGGVPGHAFVAFLCLAGVGIVVLAPTYVSFLFEGLGTQPRVGALDRDFALSNQLDPGAIASFSSPYLSIIKDSQRGLWPSSDVSMVNVYMGVVIPALALYALARQPRDGWRLWLAALAGLGLATAMGEALPLRGWLYDWFYPMRYFRHSAIFRLYFIFPLAVLAAIGCRDLARDLVSDDTSRRKLLLPVAAVVAALAAIAFLPFLGSHWEDGLPTHRALLGRGQFVFMWGGLLAIGILVRTLKSRAKPWVIGTLIVFLAGSDAILTSVAAGPTVARMGPQLEHWRALEAQHSSSLDLTAIGLRRETTACPERPLEERCRENGQLISKWPVFNAYASERNPQHLAMVQEPSLLAVATGQQRIWFASRVAHVEPSEINFDDFLRGVQTTGEVPLVIHRPSEMVDRTRTADATAPHSVAVQESELSALEAVQVELLDYSPSRLGLRVDAPDDGWLLITDRWARSWHVSVDGRAETNYVGNFIFRAVPVSAGRREIEYVYRPVAMPWLVALSWSVLLGVGGVSVAAGMRRRREPAIVVGH